MTARYVLIHSPLVGPGCWTGLAHQLRARGSETIVPDLTAAMTGAPPYYEGLAALACAAIGNSGDVTLVAHSGAGALIPSIVERQKSIAAAVFLDALLPHPEQSWFETAPPELVTHLRGLAHEDFLPPWHLWWPSGSIEKLFSDARLFEKFSAELKPVPLAYFEEKAPRTKLPVTLRCSYLRLSDAYEGEATRAEALGWRVGRQSLNHLAMLTYAEKVADLLRAKR